MGDVDIVSGKVTKEGKCDVWSKVRICYCLLIR